MRRSSVLKLIAEDPGAHGVFEQHTETKRTVYCDVYSVSRDEYFRALNNNMRPSYVFRLADYAEYKGEKVCEFEGVRYAIVRTYEDNGAIELTVEEATVDRTAVLPAEGVTT